MTSIDAEKSKATPEFTRSVYELVGGRETFDRLAIAFYRHVESDPVLRPLYPKNLWGHGSTGGAAREKTAARSMCSPVGTLSAFLIQFFGGPPEYSDSRGHPRLKMRHVKFKIGKVERDTWVSHMYAAIDEVGIEEPNRSLMRQYFADAATFLINAPERTE